jgi:hypothetical protein
MTLKISINCDNAAFQDEPCFEQLHTILYEIIEHLDTGELKTKPGETMRLNDTNGNIIGHAKFTH